MLLMVSATLLLLLLLWRMPLPPATAAAAACWTLFGSCVSVFTVNVAAAGVSLLQQQYKGMRHTHVEHTAHMVHGHMVHGHKHWLSDPASDITH